MNLKSLTTTLLKNDITVSIAESCTAGLISYLLTKTPGSSLFFKGGMVVYSLESKTNLLDLKNSLVKKANGVSAEIAETLAINIKNKFESDIGLSIVGFAGPSGKKVGTIYYALSCKNKTICKKATLSGTRNQIRKKSSILVLELLSKCIKKHKPIHEKQ